MQPESARCCRLCENYKDGVKAISWTGVVLDGFSWPGEATAAE